MRRKLTPVILVNVKICLQKNMKVVPEERKAWAILGNIRTLDDATDQ